MVTIFSLDYHIDFNIKKIFTSLKSLAMLVCLSVRLFFCPTISYAQLKNNTILCELIILS
jgi:hypothetical protein